jgi:hypothetical protein
MSEDLIIENLRKRIKFIPLSIDMIEIGIKDNIKTKQSLGLEELLKDVAFLKIAVDALYNKHDFLYTPIEKIESTLSKPIEEHSDKFPWES